LFQVLRLRELPASQMQRACLGSASGRALSLDRPEGGTHTVRGPKAPEKVVRWVEWVEGFACR